MPVPIAELFVTVGADISSAVTGLNSVGSSVQKMGNQISGAGRDLTSAITAPIVGAAAVVGGIGADFEHSFTQVRKTVEATPEELQALHEQLVALSTSPLGGGKTASELAKIAAVGGQLGLAGDELLAFTQASAGMSVATGIAADKVGEDIARIAILTGQRGPEAFNRLGSTVVNLGNQMAGTEGEILEFANRLSGALTLAGVAPPDILAISSALAELGINVEAGGTAVSTFFSKMVQGAAAGGDKLKAFANVAGVTPEVFKEMVKTDPTGAFRAIVVGLGRLKETGGPEAVLGVLKDIGVTDVRLRDVMLRLAGAQETLDKALRVGNEGWNENAALNEEVRKAMEDTTNQFALLKNELMAMAIAVWPTLKAAIMDVFAFVRSDVIPLIQGWVDAWKALDPETQRMILIFAGVAAALGPVLIILGALVTALGVLLSPIGLITLAIAALGLAWVTNFGDIQGKVKVVEQALLNLRSSLAVVGDLFRAVWILALATFDRVVREMASLWTTVLQPAIEQTGQWIFDHILKPIQDFQNLLRNVLGITPTPGLEFTPPAITAPDLTGAPEAALALARQAEQAALAQAAQLRAGGPGVAGDVNVTVNTGPISSEVDVNNMLVRMAEVISTAAQRAEAPNTPGTPGTFSVIPT